MFLVVSSGVATFEAVRSVAEPIVRLRHVTDADALWTDTPSSRCECIGVLIDFRDQVPRRCALVDRIVRGKEHVGIIAVVEANQTPLLFELAQRGVHTWVPAPPEPAQLKKAIKLVAAETGVVAESPTFPAGESGREGERNEILRPLYGPSSAMRTLRAALIKASRSDMPIVLTGESGSGKQVVAETIHRLSARGTHDFVDVNVSSIATSLFEGDLFGCAPGAYTGVVPRRGYFAAADKSTLFLDEIGELPLDLQPKILKTVETGLRYPLGSDAPHHVDVRLICASNRDMPRMVRTGRFREDLWNRIAAVMIEVPPLRNRLEDIPSLVRSLSQKYWDGSVVFKPDALRSLQHHRWTGNVRELKAVIERSLAVSGKRTLSARDLAFSPWIADHPSISGGEL